MFRDNRFFYIFTSPEWFASNAPGFDCEQSLFELDSYYYGVGTELSDKIRMLARMYDLSAHALIEYPQLDEGETAPKLQLKHTSEGQLSTWHALGEDGKLRFSVSHLN